VLVFPPHEVDVDVPMPSGFGSGLLELLVSASDLKSYVQSPTMAVVDASLANLTGNESVASRAVVSARSLSPPATPGVAAFDPNSLIWARSASQYDESARYLLQWQAAADAARYEVWRIMEGALSGLAANPTQVDLRNAAEDPAAVFELRSDQVFGLSYEDALPGLAPTRALYKVRAVGMGGEKGGFSPLIGPIWVPDIRAPAAPNLIKVAPTPTAEADRAIAISWSQSGPLDGVRFEVFVTDREPAVPVTQLALTIPAGTAPGIGGSFRGVHLQRIPGKPYEYSVQGVREAADPIDPGGVQTRDIRGAVSNARSAVAISGNGIAAPDTDQLRARGYVGEARSALDAEVTVP
jgi:hypothetical protein